MPFVEAGAEWDPNILALKSSLDGLFALYNPMRLLT
jgi:hypothetical protein